MFPRRKFPDLAACQTVLRPTNFTLNSKTLKRFCIISPGYGAYVLGGAGAAGGAQGLAHPCTILGSQQGSIGAPIIGGAMGGAMGGAPASHGVLQVGPG